SDLREALEPAFAVAQRGEDAVHPHADAAFADAPALGLVPAFRRGDGERLLRLAVAHFLFREEASETLAENFVGPVALDALGARVPAHDAAFGVEGIDRVVGRAIEEQTEALLALA